MKIVYISHLSTNIAAGLNWSVPASVCSQSQIDEVLWVNMTDVIMEHWLEVKAFHNVKEFDGKLKSLDCLPMPFNKPDIVVFEGFYYIDDVRIGKMLNKKGIPYLIIPRGSLTNLAMHNHAWLKKWIAHKLFFNSFVHKATAIQYLTRQEADDSIGQFKTPYFIVPNGFNTPQVFKDNFSSDGIVASFIGRLDMYHKGIDLLLHVMTILHKELVDAHFFLNIYGPRRYDFYKIQEEIIIRGLSDIVNVQDEICGNEKERILMNTDLFIMTSRFEGHPMGLIEALAYGIPCLVTPGTNMAEEVKKANAGWSCEGDIESIKEVLLQILSEREVFAIKGKNARELSKKYKWSVLAKKFHEDLLLILKRK